MTLPPKQRTTVRLGAVSSGIGVREVTLIPVTDKGDAVGTPMSFAVRSSQVGVADLGDHGRRHCCCWS